MKQLTVSALFLRDPECHWIFRQYSDNDDDNGLLVTDNEVQKSLVAAFIQFYPRLLVFLPVPLHGSRNYGVIAVFAIKLTRSSRDFSNYALHPNRIIQMQSENVKVPLNHSFLFAMSTVVGVRKFRMTSI